MPPNENEDTLEFAEELEDSDESVPAPAEGDTSESVGYSSQVIEVSDEFEPDPDESRDLSGFAEDAGAEASYGFDAAVPAFEGDEGEVDLAEDSNLQDSGEFPAPEELGTLEEDAPYTDEAEQILDSGAFAAVTPLADTPAEGTDAYSEGDAYAEDDPYAEPAEADAEGEPANSEEEAYPEGEDVEGAEADAYAQDETYSDDESYADDEPQRPGQIARSALDDIFNRARNIKKDD